MPLALQLLQPELPLRFDLERTLQILHLDSSLPEDHLLQTLEALSPPTWNYAPELSACNSRRRLELLAYSLVEAKRLYFHQANNRAQQR